MGSTSGKSSNGIKAVLRGVDEILNVYIQEVCWISVQRKSR